MKLFHVTTDLNHSGLFIPTTPYFHLEGEETSTKRVSLSFSIRGALTAMPRGGYLLQETLQQNNQLLRVCELDIEKAGLRMQDLILPHALVKNGFVKDALITEEVWVLKTFQAQNVFDIRLQYWEEFDEEIYPDWFNYKKEPIPIMTVIDNIVFQIEKEKNKNEKKTVLQ